MCVYVCLGRALCLDDNFVLMDATHPQQTADATHPQFAAVVAIIIPVNMDT